MRVTERTPPSHTDEGLRAALEIRSRWPEAGILVLSQYVEKKYAAELFAAHSDRVGYLLKDRVGDVLDALDRVAAGGAAFDADVVRRPIARTSHADPLQRLTPPERDVLELMARGHTTPGIAGALHVSQSAVERHGNAIFDNLGLTAAGGYRRRVLAVLRYLGSSSITSTPAGGRGAARPHGRACSAAAGSPRTP